MAADVQVPLPFFTQDCAGLQQSLGLGRRPLDDVEKLVRCLGKARSCGDWPGIRSFLERWRHWRWKDWACTSHLYILPGVLFTWPIWAHPCSLPCAKLLPSAFFLAMAASVEAGPLTDPPERVANLLASFVPDFLEATCGGWTQDCKECSGTGLCK